MSTLLQNIMGMLTRRKFTKIRSGDYLVIGRYETPQEVLKPNPKVESKLVSATDLASFVNNGTKLVKLEPFSLVAGAGGSSTMPINYNIIEISWDGLGNGVYEFNLPTAASMKYRAVRITTNGNLDPGAQDKIDITAASGETIDGASTFQISKRYEGIMIWSTGTEWVIIQAKAH